MATTNLTTTVRGLAFTTKQLDADAAWLMCVGHAAPCEISRNQRGVHIDGIGWIPLAESEPLIREFYASLGWEIPEGVLQSPSYVEMEALLGLD